MNALKKLSNFFGQNMAVIVIAVAALALLAPGSVSFIKTSYVNTLLGIVMFGMGLTLRPVSYTHLDVYKRQELDIFCSPARRMMAL